MRLLPSAASAIWLKLRTAKSFTCPGMIRCRRARISVNWLIAVLNLPRSDGLHVDLIHIAQHARLQIIGVGRWQIDPIERRLRLTRRSDAENLPLRCRKRDHDDIVLILPVSGLPFRGKNADNPKRHALYLYERSNRVLIGSEELTANRLPNKCNECRLAFVVLSDGSSGRDLPICDGRVIGADALNCGRPILVFIRDLTELPDEVADLGNGRRLPPDRLHVVHRKGRSASKARSEPARERGARHHDEKVGPEALDLLSHGLVGSLPHSLHRNESGDTNENAEHGQRGPHPVAIDSLGRDP